MTLHSLEVALVRLHTELRILERVAGEHVCMGARIALDDVRDEWISLASTPRSKLTAIEGGAA